jgi:hypothetical protein
MTSRGSNARVRELVRVPDVEVRWRERPRPAPPRVLSRSEACPRKALTGAIGRLGDPTVTYASLSRMISRRDGYLACFVRDGHPRALSQRDHRMLANFFGVSERELGIRDLWAPLAA